MCLWLKSLTSQECSVIIVRMKTVSHLVRHVISLLVSSTSSHFQSTTTRSTTWTARPSPQDDTLHRAPLSEPIQSTSSAKEPLSHVNYECGRNPRNTSPTANALVSEKLPDVAVNACNVQCGPISSFVACRQPSDLCTWRQR